MRIEVLLYDGFDEIDAIGPYEIFANAARGGAPFEVELVAAHRAGEVRGSHGTVVAVSRTLGDPDAVVVPGGGWNDRSPAGAWHEARRGTLPARLAALAPNLRWLASVCTGAMLLAEAGLLRGRPATTHHSALDQLPAYGAHVIDARVVDDGNVITSAGVTAGLDLALWLVEREVGPHIAEEVATEIERDRIGQVAFGPSASAVRPVDPRLVLDQSRTMPITP